MDMDCEIVGDSTRPGAATAMNGASGNSTMAPASKDGHGPGLIAIDSTVAIDRSMSTTEREIVRNTMPSDTATEISGSHVFQTSISFQEGHLVDELHRLLENLDQASINLSESTTIQLGHWGIFDQGENRLERFMETNLPTLLMCTRIAHDKIAIFGLHLKGEGSTIYAATAGRKYPLDVDWDEDIDEILQGVERGLASLPLEFADEGYTYSFGERSNEGDLWIYARKTVPAGESRKPTIFRSRAVLVPLRNNDHVAPLNWALPLDFAIGFILMLVYQLVLSNGVLQALLVASVWLTAWWLFKLGQRQLNRRIGIRPWASLNWS